MSTDLDRDIVNDDTSGPADPFCLETTGRSTVSDETPSSAVGLVEPGGRYELGEEIARGGMGAIHVAIDRTLGRQVAVKLLPGRPGPASRAARAGFGLVPRRPRPAG